MKLATFNVNGINSRLPNLLAWLARAAPDVVCLQELKAPDDRFPAKALAEVGYGSIWHGQQSWNGVAVLARGSLPKEIRRGLPGDSNDTHSRYLEAEVAGVVIGCLYLPNGSAASTCDPRSLRATIEAGLDRHVTRAASRRARVHVLGLFQESLDARRGAAHRSHPAQQDGG